MKAHTQYFFLVVMNDRYINLYSSASDPSHLTWIRILGSTFRKSGSGSSDPPFRYSGSGSSDSSFRYSGSGSSDPRLEKVDPDPGSKWIRIRVPIFNIFHIFYKEIHVGQITILIFVTAKKAFLR